MYTYRYPRPALTVDALIIAGHKKPKSLLLIRRAAQPFKEKWALPGGFINMDETLEKACIRELFEETGLRVKKLDQFKAFDAIGRDPRHRTISVVFYSFLDNEPDVSGNDDATEARWFPLDGLPPLAFDHEDIVRQFLKEKGLNS